MAPVADCVNGAGGDSRSDGKLSEATRSGRGGDDALSQLQAMLGGIAAQAATAATAAIAAVLANEGVRDLLASAVRPGVAWAAG